MGGKIVSFPRVHWSIRASAAAWWSPRPCGPGSAGLVRCGPVLPVFSCVRDRDPKGGVVVPFTLSVDQIIGLLFDGCTFNRCTHRFQIMDGFVPCQVGGILSSLFSGGGEVMKIRIVEGTWLKAGRPSVLGNPGTYMAKGKESRKKGNLILIPQPNYRVADDFCMTWIR